MITLLSLYVIITVMTILAGASDIKLHGMTCLPQHKIIEDSRTTVKENYTFMRCVQTCLAQTDLRAAR